VFGRRVVVRLRLVMRGGKRSGCGRGQGSGGPWTGGSSAMQEVNGTNGFEGSERQQEEQEGRLRGVRCVEQGRICSQSPRAGDMSRAHNVGITFKLHRRPSPTVEAAVDAACLL
jgi:hypothetical protein